jgi:hypothetical protein
MCKSRSPSELKVGLIFLRESGCGTFDAFENDLESHSLVKALVFKRHVLGHNTQYKEKNNFYLKQNNDSQLIHAQASDEHHHQQYFIEQIKPVHS